MRAGWKSTTIGKVCEVIAGQSPEGEFYNEEGIGLPFYQGKKEFQDKYIGAPRIWTRRTTKEAQAGDILMSVRAPVGPVNFATEKSCIGRGLASIRASDTLNRDYLFYFIRSKESEISGNEGAVFASINKSQIEGIQLPLPPLPEQKRIVAILDEAFEGIATATANAEKNLANARELFETYLNAKLSRADGWVERKIGDSDLLQIIDGDRGTNYPSKADFFESEFCLFLNTKNVRPDGFNFDTTAFITMEKDRQLRKGKLKRRDVVLTTRGTIGNIALYDDTVEFDHIRINSGILIFRPNEKIILSEYLFEMLRSGVVKSQITQFVSGAAQPQLPIHTLSKFSIPVPKALADQKEIVDRLRALSSESKRLEGIYQQKLEGLTELKQAILHKAFSGGLTATAAKSLVEAAE